MTWICVLSTTLILAAIQDLKVTQLADLGVTISTTQLASSVIQAITTALQT